MKLFKSGAGAILVCFIVAAFLFVNCGGPIDIVDELFLLTAINSSYTLSTPDADKDQHALFKAVWGYVNPDRAQDPSAPDPVSPYRGEVGLYVEFKTDIGTFYFQQPTPVKESYDDEGVTKYRWKIELDIGAKNEPTNPIHYHIFAWAQNIGSLTPPQGIPDYYDIWVDASIEYHPYEE